MSTPHEIRQARKFAEAQAHYDAASDDDSHALDFEDYIDEQMAREIAEDEWRGRAWPALTAINDLVTDDSRAEPVYPHTLAEALLQRERDLTANELLQIIIHSNDSSAVMRAALHLSILLDPSRDEYIADRASDILREQERRLDGRDDEAREIWERSA